MAVDRNTSNLPQICTPDDMNLLRDIFDQALKPFGLDRDFAEAEELARKLTEAFQDGNRTRQDPTMALGIPSSRPNQPA